MLRSNNITPRIVVLEECKLTSLYTDLHYSATGKTQFMVLSLQLKTKLHDAISIGGESVQQTETARLLGVKIDQHLKNRQQKRASPPRPTHAEAEGCHTIHAHEILSDLRIAYSLICSSTQWHRRGANQAPRFQAKAQEKVLWR